MDNNSLVIPKRTEGCRNADIVTHDLYLYYKSQIKPVESITGGETYGSYNITETIYSSILKDLNALIIDAIVLENFEFKLPYRLGVLSMVQKKVPYKLDENGNLMTKYLSVDYKSTKELWRNDSEALRLKSLIFYTNEHTDGNRMAYRWSKKQVGVTGIDSYYFLPCRKMKRRPAELLKENKGLCFFENTTYKDKMEKIFNSLPNNK